MDRTTEKQQRQAEFTSRLQNSARRTRLAPLFDLIMPPICIHCYRQISEHGQLCPTCWSHIDFITRPLCDITGLPLPYDIDPYGKNSTSISALALAQPPAYQRARAVARFGEVLRTLIHRFKYGDRREGLALFGRWMLWAGHELLLDCDLIVPVPLYRTRLWQRRFNQAALLSFELSRLTGLPVDVLNLKRHRATRSQVGLSQSARRRNVSGAFAVTARGKQRFKNRKILLVDDVLTTGSTVEACTRTLKRAGATHVDVLVLARAEQKESMESNFLLL